MMPTTNAKWGVTKENKKKVSKPRNIWYRNKHVLKMHYTTSLII